MKRVMTVIVAGILIPACGGGGGGSAPPPAPPPFVQALGFDDEVRALAGAGDGSGDVLVAGLFGHYSCQAAAGIVRLNENGSPDSNWNSGAGFDLAVTALATSADGTNDVFAGGLFTSYDGSAAARIIRLNADGTPDGGFSSGTGFDADVAALAAANDGTGDLFVGGNFSDYNGTAAAGIIRLNADGSPDAGFSSGLGFSGEVLCIAPAEDGSADIYVGGLITAYDGNVTNGIVRLNTDGTIDAGFNTGTGFDFDVKTIAPAADGSGDVYVGGAFTDYNGTGANRILRLNPDGSIDPAFAVGSGFTDAVWSISRAGDGSGDVFVVGEFTVFNGTFANRAARLNPDGSPQAGFGVGPGFLSTVRTSLASENGSGHLYCGGLFRHFAGSGANRFVRLNPNGTPDPGLPTGSGFNLNVLAIATALDGSGRVYLGGNFLRFDGAVRNRIAAVAQNGTPDNTFDVGIGFNSEVRLLATAADGSGDLFAAGLFTMYNGATANRLVRLNSDGTIDSGFSAGTGLNNAPWAMALDSNGDLIVGGSFTTYNGTAAVGIVRLNPDGTIDPGFVTGMGLNGTPLAIQPATDGSGDVYVGGDFTTYDGSAAPQLIRLDSDGSLDAGFNVGSGFNNFVWAVAPLTDGSGRVYAGGSFSSFNLSVQNRMVRLNSDGTLDPTFSIGSGFDDTVEVITPAEDGSGDVYVGGQFTNYNGTPVNRIIRLNSDGSIDPAFAVGAGADDAVLTIVPAANGKVLVGGAFDVYRNHVVDRLVRIRADGTVD